MAEAAPQILPGKWGCVACGRPFKIRFTPGTLNRWATAPTSMPESKCRCGGAIAPVDNAARATENTIRENARVLAEETQWHDEED